MTDKKYYIARGNNLGSTERSSKFEYQGELLSIFEKDPSIRGLIATSVMGYCVNEQFNQWLEQNEEASLSEIQQAKYDFATPKQKAMINQKTKEAKRRYQPLFENIENIYRIIKEDIGITPAKIENDKIKLSEEEYLIHNIPISGKIEDLESRHDLGFLPSEWFGKLESYSECRLCTSFFKANKEKISEKIPAGKSLAFIIDTTSPVFQQLLHLDLAEYCRALAQNDLSQYSDKDQKLLTELKELSESSNGENEYGFGAGGSTKIALNHPDWAWIPGGVPSQYVVGIVANNIEKGSEDEKFALKAGEIFGVPVVDKTLSLIKETTQFNEQE